MPRLLALDYGDKKTGVAISDELHISVRPLPALRTPDRSTLLDRIVKLVNEYGIERIIVGLPLTADQQCGHQAQRVLSFISDLTTRTALPIDTVDETLTSHIAERELQSEHQTKRIQDKGLIDSRAAGIILTSFINH